MVAAFVVRARGWRGGGDGVGKGEDKAVAGAEEASRKTEGGEEAVAGGEEASESREKAGEDEEDVRAWVRQRLSHHLVPKYVFWTDGFPKTASGKVQKFRLREEGMRALGRGEGLGVGEGG